MIVNFFGLIIDWLLTRNWRRVAVLIIPLGFLIPILILAVLGAATSPEELAQDYLRAGERELQDAEQDWEFAIGADADATQQTKVGRYAEALFRRALELKSDDPRTRFVVGAMLGNRGAISQALAYMKSLAPENKRGYDAAHAWIANFMLQNGSIPESQLELFRHHLDLGIQWEQAPPYLLRVAAQFALADKDPGAAIELLQKSAEMQPELEGEVFNLAVQTGKKLVADETAEKALPRIFESLQEGTITSVDRITLSNILFYQDKIAEAQQALVDGLDEENLSEQDRADLKRALSEHYRKRFEASLKLTADNWSADINMLNAAYQADPSNPAIAEQVAMLARIGGNSPPDELMDQLNARLAQGTATPVMHFWIAEANIIRAEYDEAIGHLESIVSRLPDAAHAHNNLAYAIAISQPSRMDEALQHAKSAVQYGPRVADFHDTLGFILLRLDRVSEAISEIELAIELQPGRADFHTRAAEAYEKQGNAELAKLHRQFAAKQNESNDGTPED